MTITTRRTLAAHDWTHSIRHGGCDTIKAGAANRDRIEGYRKTEEIGRLNSNTASQVGAQRTEREAQNSRLFQRHKLSCGQAYVYGRTKCHISARV